MWKHHLEDPFKADTRLGGLRACPRITRTHIYPNSFQKMGVSYAVKG